MNICIVIPTFKYLQQAGARIRYSRMREELDILDLLVDFREVSELNHLKAFEHDIYIFSKCYDARSIVLSHYLKQHNKIVGVDLFDDYFSQSKDSRFSSLRYWLHSLVSQCDFGMCSTQNMKSVAEEYLVTQPIHVMNDPYGQFSTEFLAKSLDTKLEVLQNTKRLEILWFGMGDNPNFDVGIKDLVGYSGWLNDIKGKGLDVSLRILTNRRALTIDNFALLRKLPIEFVIEEWSEEAEQRLLAAAFMCFLPVNSQSFSAVKSLNRAISCLSHGVQVLSPGLDLYKRLEGFIYRTSLEINKDIELGKPKLRSDSLDDLRGLMNQYASPKVEAKLLAGFLSEIYEHASNRFTELTEFNAAPTHVLLHGLNTSSDAHKFIQRLKGLSVSTPFCAVKLNFDICIYIDKKSHQLNVAVNTKTLRLLQIDSEYLLKKEELFPSRSYRLIEPVFFASIDSNILHKQFLFDVAEQPFSALSEYSEVMSGCIKIVKKLLPFASISVSENSKLPWWIEAPAVHIEEMV
ncbi:hypothetical protein [Paraglaciecola sp.]|uniref:hypothetical protein n=1 Tax=Paraglaciecola sp. TaxID=1920173 RepID=UPI00329A5E38